MKVSDKLLLAGAGPVADRVRYSETMAANIKLYSLRSGVECDTDAAAHYCRSNVRLMRFVLSSRVVDSKLCCCGRCVVADTASRTLHWRFCCLSWPQRCARRRIR